MNRRLVLMIIAVLASGWIGLGPAAIAGPLDVWLDVDCANGVGEVDDGLMMIQVFHSPKLRARGVSVVYGNTDLAKATPIARDIVEKFGPADLPVLPGAASSAELGGENEATEALAEAIRQRPLTILAVGPVTNIATLVKLHPELQSRIQRIVMVAGRREGQRFAVSGRTLSDFNFEHDPEAMRVILDTSIPLTFAPWEVSAKVWITRDDLNTLAATGSSGKWVARICADWIKRWEKHVGPWGFNPFDSLAAGWLTHPQLFETIPVQARIKFGGDDGAKPVGREPGDPKPYLIVNRTEPSDREILYAFRADSRFKGVLLRRLAGAAGVEIPNVDRLAQAATEFDHTILDDLLQKHVDDRGRVDYASLKTDADLLDKYIEALDAADPRLLGRDEHLAFLINAYNAFTLRLIVENYPVKSIKDIPAEKRWEARRWRVGGQTLSLDQIEHEQIRRLFGEPRIHFALVCAAISCPPLRAEAYTGARLEEQLADQSRYVHAHDRWFRYDTQSNTVELTRLYDWYGDDFEMVADSVVEYAANYCPPLRKALAAKRQPHVRWIQYDWDLNDQENRY